MGIVVGMLLAMGVLLVWASFWESPLKVRKPHSGWNGELNAARFNGVSVPMFTLASALLGFFAALCVLALTRIPVAAVLAGVAGTLVLPLTVTSRARRNRARRVELWPDAVDHLISGIRAGLSMPEALIAISHRGPQELQSDFLEFARYYRASGNFDQSLEHFKQTLADPTADRVVEALRITSTVGGTELGTLLATLNRFLRQDLKVRGELRARQSWTLGGARVASAAPWLVLLMLATRDEAAQAFRSPQGMILIVVGAVLTVCAYRLMLLLGRLPAEERVLI